MKVPVDWIREFAPVEMSADQIADRLTMAGLEVEASEESDVGIVLDIKVTPNRGDCLSVLGLARELAASCRIPFRGRRVVPSSADEPPDAAAYTAVTIEAPDLCPRYAARVVEDLRIGESPAWIQDRLAAAGMRPISNVVDITNYVMLETGQPLHAFDYDTLTERRIVVRRARNGEVLTTLDGVERLLNNDMLVIADARRPVALAGIMGGAETEITERTRTLLLESAHFDRRCIRRTARTLALNTEASYRFERIVDPEGVVYAADLACKLIEELGAGRPVMGVVDVYPGRGELRSVVLRLSRCRLLMGYEPSAEDVTQALERLGFGLVQVDAGVWEVRPPSWRPDIVREVDVVEEVARVLGYDRIPERLMTGLTTRGMDTEEARFRDAVRDNLIGAGLQEVVCHTLMAPSDLDDPSPETQRVAIRSALSAELSGLRRSLVPGLCDVASRNARRGLGPLAFFEVGPVFALTRDGTYLERDAVAGLVSGRTAPRSWHKLTAEVTPFYVGKGLVERISGQWKLQLRFQPSDDPRLHPTRQAAVTLDGHRIGVVGELHPAKHADLHLRERCVVFELLLEPLRLAASVARPTPAQLSKYPSVARDLAPRVQMDVPYEDVRARVEEVAGEWLAELTLVDVFSGPPLPEGTRSFTLSLVFRAGDRTLTDAEVDGVVDRMRERLKLELGATFQEAG